MVKSGDIRAGGAFVEIGADLGPFRKGLQAASDLLKDWGGSITSWGAKVAAVGALFSAPFIAAAKAFEAEAMVPGANLLNKQQLEALTVFLQAQRNLSDAARNAFLEVGGAFYNSIVNATSAAFPLILKIINGITYALNYTAAWIRENAALVESIATVALVVAGVGLAMVTVGSAVTAIGAGLGIAAAAAGVLLNPIVLISAATIGIVGYLLKMSGALGFIGQVAGAVFGYISEALRAIVNAIGAGEFQAAWNVVLTGMQAAWQTTVSYIKDAWIIIQGEISKVGVQIVIGLMAVWEELGTTIKRVFDQAVAYANVALGSVMDGIKTILSGMEQAGLLKQENGKIFGIDMTRNFTVDAAMKNAGAFAKDGAAIDRGVARQQLQDTLLKMFEGVTRSKLLDNALDPKKLQAIEQYRSALGVANGFDPAINFNGYVTEMGKIKSEAVGTFSSSALGQIGASSIDKEIADSSKKTAKATEGILKTILANGLGGIDLA